MISSKKFVNLNNINAVIFDMDGTMIANAKYHDLAWQELLQKHGIVLTEEERKEKISGRRNHEIVGILFGNETPAETREAYAQAKEQIYRNLYSPHIKEVSGLSSLIQKLQERKLKLAIATTAPKKNRDFGLEAIHLSNTFDVIVGNEDVTHGKPDPEIYLEAAKRLGVNPKECLAFEDSPAGVEAAKNAGMRVVGLATSHTEKELNDAEIVVEDFSQIELE